MDVVKMVLDRTNLVQYNEKFKENPRPVQLSLRPNLHGLICSPFPMPSAQALQFAKNYQIFISFSEINEIRRGKNSKDFQNLWEGECKCRDCFVIFYGTEFCLKTLSICVLPDRRNGIGSSFKSNEDDNLVQSLLDGLDLVWKGQKNLSYLSKLNIWMHRVFESISSNGKITLEQLTNNLPDKLNISISVDKMAEMLEKYGENESVGLRLKFKGFASLIQEILQDREEERITSCFRRFTSEDLRLVSMDGFKNFLMSEQGEVEDEIGRSSLAAQEYFKTVEEGNKFMTMADAGNYLFSKENSVWNSKFDVVHQDMSQPLSHYWIASSHNTYITRDQFSSESSPEAYVRALCQGCRCVEIDCHDGPNENPIVYHRKTLNSKISLVSVLEAIRDYAFKTSEYPVVISIENHCSPRQEKVMANKIIEIFGDLLVKEPLRDSETKLPSPNDLKRRIILKGKKQWYSQEGDRRSTQDTDISNAIKSGKMYLENEAGEWEPFFFALVGKTLHYSAIEILDEQKENGEAKTPSPYAELHFKEIWYHNDKDLSTQEAGDRLISYGVEGCFLVRNRKGRAGEYSLCILSNGTPRHHVILSRTNDESGKQIFSLFSDFSQVFDSLYHLIRHYRNSPFEPKNINVPLLTDPVPQPTRYLSEVWFHPNLNRAGSEIILAKASQTGAYLVRFTEDKSRFVISLRIGQLIKHCQISQDGRLLVVGNKKFESLSDLVQYYTNNSFYKWVKLGTPVTTNGLQFSDENKRSTSNQVFTQTGYVFTAEEIQVRAIQNSDPDAPVETHLQFSKGDVITNVEKFEGDFWRGDLDDQKQKLFPKASVEDVELVDSPFGTRKGCLEFEKLSLVKSTKPEFAYFLETDTQFTLTNIPFRFRAAISNADEAKEWEIVLNKCLNDTRSARGSRIGTISRMPIIRSMVEAVWTKAKNWKRNVNVKVTKEFSNLIVYGATVPLPRQGEGSQGSGVHNHNEIVSLKETVAEKLIYSEPDFVVSFTKVQLLRIYPKHTRIFSDNFNPTYFWNAGAQLVAMNYQTPEKYMQIYRGKFRQNGKCGYILKPDFLLNEKFNPADEGALAEFSIQPMRLRVTIMAGRHIFVENKGIMNPYVTVEIFGAPFDSQKVQTRTIAENGLNPFWNEKFVFEIKNPALALIRFSAATEDTNPSDFIGENTYPVPSLRNGYRSVTLLNGFGEELLSTLLIHLETNT